MSVVYRVVFCFLFLTQLYFSQNNKIFGIINGEAVSNVSISIAELGFSTVSNTNGEYNLFNVPKGKYEIVFSHLGFKQYIKIIEIKDNENYQLNVELEKILLHIGEGIVVSARTQNLVKEVSLPIEYIDVAKLTNSTHATPSDLLNRQPGISVVKDGPWATSVNVRGLGKQNLVYLIDGNRVETSTNIAAGLSLINMNDIESIEIIKSGLSSLYGTGATGGVVSIRTKEAQFRDNIYLSSQFISSFNSVNNSYSNYLNFKTGNYNWSAKLSGSFRRADDTETPNGTLINSSFKDENLNATIKIVPFNDFILNIAYQKFSAYDVGIPGGAPFPKTATATYKYANRELFSSSIDYHNISKKLIKTSFKYYHQLIGRSVEIKPNSFVTANPKADHTTNGLLFQSDWYLSLSNYFIAGIDFWERKYEGTRMVTNLAKDVISLDKPIPNSKFKSFGLFAKDDMNFLDNSLRISLSGRYDFINITNEETKNPVYVIVGGVKNENIKNELASFEAYDEINKSLSGGLGAIYKFTDEYDFVFNLGYNFRSPSLEERYQYIDLGGIVYLGNPKLKPEEGIFLDAGFRVWENNINFKFNTFVNSFSNLVIDDVLIEDSIYIKQNVAEARLYGFDSRIDYNFYDDYILYVSAAYVRGKDLTQDENLPQISPFNSLVGIIIPIENYLQIDLSATIVSDQEKTGLGENRTGGFTYFDISLESENIRFKFANLKIVAGVQNIFNREYREHLSTYRGIDLVEPGRNIFAKIIFEFE